jgi:hypothetical protein
VTCIKSKRTDDISTNVNAPVIRRIVGEGRCGDEVNQDIRLRRAVQVSKKKDETIPIERALCIMLESMFLHGRVNQA